MNIKNTFRSLVFAGALALSQASAKNIDDTKTQVYECLAESSEMKCIFYIGVDGNKVSNTQFTVESEQVIASQKSLENFLEGRPTKKGGKWGGKGIGLYVTDQNGKPLNYNPDWLKSVECAKMK